MMKNRNDGKDVKRTKEQLGAVIKRMMDGERMSLREAQKRIGFQSADLSRIQNGKLERFTIDKLIRVANALGYAVDFEMKLTDDGKSFGKEGGK